MRPLRCAVARRLPRVDQRLERRAHPRRRTPASSIVAREPRARRLVEDRAPDREAAARSARARRRAKPSRQRVDSARSARAARRRGSTGSRSAISASIARPLGGAHAARASTTRDRCRGCRGASSRAAPCPARAAAPRGGMISSSSSWPLACVGLAQRPDLRLVLEAPVDHVVGVVRHEALDDLLERPRDRASCRSSARGRTRPDSLPGSSTGRPTHQPRPVAALSASWP